MLGDSSAQTSGQWKERLAEKKRSAALQMRARLKEVVTRDLPPGECIAVSVVRSDCVRSFKGLIVADPNKILTY